MVIVSISYGLGNQMCQYAAARALALRNKSSLILDTSYFRQKSDYAHEMYGLHFFNIKNRQLKNLRFSYYLKGVIKKGWFGKSAAYFTETTSLEFVPEVIPCKKGLIFLEGIFLNEKYFADYADTIRNDFTFRNMDAENLNLGQEIANKPSISVHVRRGEFVKKANYGTSPLAYYEKAMAYINSTIPGAAWYFFSDDIEWVKENLPRPENAWYLSHNTGANSYKDMYLMSCCKHNIIANSSFSWWGAWLNNNPQKIVTAPSGWIIRQGVQTKGLVPENWLLF